MEDLRQRETPAPERSLAALEDALLMLGLSEALSEAEVLPSFLTDLMAKFEVQISDLCERYGVDRVADLPRSGAQKIAPIIEEYLIQASVIIGRQLDKCAATSKEFGSGLDGIYAKGEIFTSDIRMLMGYWARVAAELPSMVDLQIYSKLCDGYVDTQHRTHGSAHSKDDFNQLAEVVSNAKLDQGKVIAPQEFVLLDTTVLPKSVVRKARRAIGRKFGLIERHQEVSANRSAVTVLMDQLQEKQPHHALIHDFSLHINNIAENLDLDDPENAERFLGVLNVVFYYMAKDGVVIPVDETLETMLRLHAQLQERNSDEVIADIPKPHEVAKLIPQEDEPKDVSAETRLMELVLGAKARPLAKLLGVDEGGLKQLRDGLHKLGLDTPGIGLVCSLVHDQLDRVLSVAESLRPGKGVGSREQLEQILQKLHKDLQDVNFAIKAGKLVGKDVLDDVIAKLNSIFSPESR